MCGLEAYGLDSHDLFIFRLGTEQYVTIFHQRHHYFGSRMSVVPQLFAEVQISRDGQSHAACYFQGFPAGFCPFGGECGGYA